MSTPSTTAGHRTPRADCVADTTGALVFDVAGAGGPDAVLVLKRRGGKSPADELRLPLTPSGEDTLRAVLPMTLELAEGRWDVYTRTGEAVRPGTRDLRALVDQDPAPGRVTVRVPYPTADGRLAVRCWVRAPHAEAGAIGLAPERDAVSVEGVLYGVELGEGAVAQARLRSGSREYEAPVTGEGRAFVFTLPYGPLAEGAGGEGLWELWLRPAADAAAVRISRILDDVWDKKSVFVYPRRRVADRIAAPCYTGDNNLCVRITAAG